MNGILAAQFFAALTDLLVPLRCAGCRSAGVECCPACLAAFGPPQLVDVPGVGPPVYALAEYRGAARELVLAFKERGRRALAEWFGALVALALPLLAPSPWWLVPAPSRPGAARQRGGSHMVRVAERAQTAFVAPVLGFSGGVRDSVGLDPDARLRNLAGRVSVRGKGLPPPGSGVVLLDDVVTSGATARSCVDALAGAGIGVSAVLTLTSAARDVSTGSFGSRPQG